MKENIGRNFATSAELSHPLLQEIPSLLRNIWFQQYQCLETGEKLFLRMERLFEHPGQKNSNFVDLLTFEVAAIEDLLEWEEEYGEKEFIALDPDYIFFDHSISDTQAQFSIGSLDHKTMEFHSDIEIIVSLHEQGIVIDYQDDDEPVLWRLIKK